VNPFVDRRRARAVSEHRSSPAGEFQLIVPGENGKAAGRHPLDVIVELKSVLLVAQKKLRRNIVEDTANYGILRLQATARIAFGEAMGQGAVTAMRPPVLGQA
jgi:hypothetical protein